MDERTRIMKVRVNPKHVRIFIYRKVWEREERSDDAIGLFLEMVKDIGKALGLEVGVFGRRAVVMSTESETGCVCEICGEPGICALGGYVCKNGHGVRSAGV